MVQITTVGGQLVALTLMEWADLCAGVRQLAGEPAEGSPIELDGHGFAVFGRPGESGGNSG